MKRGILMDFDDTLVETTVYFNQAKSWFATLMAGMGFPAEKALSTLNEYDIKNVQLSGGFFKDCFPRALVRLMSIAVAFMAQITAAKRGRKLKTWAGGCTGSQSGQSRALKTF
ncbi:hypothetical protein Psch_00499 [Pelotomaculum schinkii]|uniref:Phosphoglycolate phosphatase n=1 Tax=Pelotomaculum schinkii TaxID=78350 RepID=A0A4Y7RDA2_9FIRM|nr:MULTISPECIES: hypothetical protein [Pelotomaculum]TEB06964.1 hypothetical protein Psch_00499 [Pelotomaculum schinkii]TEB16874.1 hypothetical protein Psfp_01044 [Pelotomaculum sp. FP]